METRTYFLRWLSTKLFLINVGTYVTIGSIMFLQSVIARSSALPGLAATFIAFFVVSFLRAIYESLIIYEAPFKSLSLSKMLVLTAIMSSAMTFITYFLKPLLGYFSIPVALFFSIVVVGKLKTLLWSTMQRPGFFAELPAPLKVDLMLRYVFYALLVGCSYVFYGMYGLSFCVAFALAFCVAMVTEELINVVHIYTMQPTVQSLLGIGIWSIICAIFSAIMIVVLIKWCGCLPPAATIASVILVKIIQPLGSRKFILRL